MRSMRMNPMSLNSRQPPAGATPFNPLSLASLLLWLEPSTGVTTSGSDVTQWTDQKSAVPFTPGANKPVVNAAGFNGRQSIYSDATAIKYLVNAPYSIATAFTMIVAVKRDGGATYQRIVDLYGTKLVTVRDASPTWQVYNEGTFYVGPAAGASEAKVLTFKQKAVGGELYVNGALVASGAGNARSGTQLSLFANPFAEPFKGYMGDFILLDGTAPSAAADQVLAENYMIAKWGT